MQVKKHFKKFEYINYRRHQYTPVSSDIMMSKTVDNLITYVLYFNKHLVL